MYCEDVSQQAIMTVSFVSKMSGEISMNLLRGKKTFCLNLSRLRFLKALLLIVSVGGFSGQRVNF